MSKSIDSWEITNSNGPIAGGPNSQIRCKPSEYPDPGGRGYVNRRPAPILGADIDDSSSI